MNNKPKAEMLSSLPEEILFRIISFLPFESAIQTVFLSKTWRNLWNSPLVQHGTTEGISAAVSCFVRNFQTQDPIKFARKLEFHFSYFNTLLAVLEPNNNTLHLHFSSHEHKQSSKNFLLNLEQNYDDHPLPHHPFSSSFFVRSLCLSRVNHLTNEAVSSVFSGFHFLENLKIISCSGLSSLKINSTVKLLSLEIFDCPKLKLVKIKSFKLKSLRYRGFWPSFRFMYHFNLAEAMFDCRQGKHGPKHRIHRSFESNSVLLAIKNAEILTLCRWVFEALICRFLSTFEANFQFYGLKELWWIDNQFKTGNFGSLISFLKLCPSLERLFITIDPKTYGEARSVGLPEKVSKHTRLENLRQVKLEGQTSYRDAVSLAEALQEFVIVQPQILLSFSDSDGKRNLMKLSQSDNSRLCHVLEVEDTKDTCPKRVHMGL